MEGVMLYDNVWNQVVFGVEHVSISKFHKFAFSNPRNIDMKIT